MKLTLQLCANIGRIAPERYHSGLREAAREWIDWPTTFQELLVQGRIWDFKDLYIAAVTAFSDPEDRLLLGTDDIKRSLIDDWVLEEGDESTNLALLDMLLEPAQLRSYYPDEVRSRAEAIIAHSPEVMRSRSFIRWILANAADALSGKKKGDDDSWLAVDTHLQGFPGLVWYTEGCFLPGVYVPRNTENPGWVIPEPPLGMNEPIQLALNLAKQLKDYNAQVACYKLLIFQSQDPTKLFQELAELQKLMLGDRKGHLETLMCSYLVCKDRPGKQKLLEELEQSGDWGDSTISSDGLTYWARDFIERAVKRSLEGPRSTVRLRNPADFYLDKGLPWEVQEFTWQNTELDRFPTTSVHPTETHIRHTPAARAYLQQQRMRPYSRPSSPYREYSSRLEPLPQALTNSRRDDFYIDRRQREETERQEMELVRARRDFEAAKEKREREEAEKKERELYRAKRELEVVKEKHEREVKDQQDRETRERLAQAERLLREQEEINKKQTEEMKMREMELGRLEREFKQAKERQELEARAQQEQQTRERLERAELSLRDQAERLRRAEDRSYQEWLSGRDFRRESNARGKLVRGRRGIRFVATSSSSSESYFSDSPPSRDDEDSSDSNSIRRKNKNTVIGSDSEDESEQEGRIHRRSSRVEELRSGPRRDEDDRQYGNDPANLQRNSCTDIILYKGVQDIMPPDAQMVEDPLIMPTSPVSLPAEARPGSRRASTTGQVPNPSQITSKPDILLI